jgi:hypothetical protein
MIRTTIILMAGLAADEGIAGARVWRGRPQYSYYGEYGYPAPFGYGIAYAPVPSRGFEYGYYGPRYLWTAPARYYGPAFGYAEW